MDPGGSQCQNWLPLLFLLHFDSWRLFCNGGENNDAIGDI